MLYATNGIRSDENFNKAVVGVASVWHVNTERSPSSCNRHLLDLAQRAKGSLSNVGIVAYQFSQ
jgi:dihydroxy-acid dehydratase